MMGWDGMKKIIMSILPILVISCASTHFNIEIDALGDDSEYNKTYIIMPSEDIEKNQLLFSEVKKYLVKIFNSKGYRSMDNESEADMIIMIDYNINYLGRKEVVDMSSAWITALGNYGRSQKGGPIEQADTKIIEQYKRSIDIVAFDLQALIQNDEIKKLWHTSVTSVGTSSDLRKVLPYMLVGAKDYLGKSTKSVISIDVPENSPEVNDLIN
jgi:hypothetical protein